MPKSLVLASSLVVIIFLDQITKNWADQNMVIRGWVKLMPYDNYGVLFGIPLPYYVTIVLSTIFLIILLYLFVRYQNMPKIFYWGLALSVAGGVSNLVDRFNYGFVRDFIDLAILPVFNLADVAIITGVIFIIWGVIHYEQPQKI